jgi:CBS domain containing-hemolysin-like protein
MAVGIATGVMTFLILVFGEIFPKTVAIQHNVAVARPMENRAVSEDEKNPDMAISTTSKTSSIVIFSFSCDIRRSN